VRNDSATANILFNDFIESPFSMAAALNNEASQGRMVIITIKKDNRERV